MKRVSVSLISLIGLAAAACSPVKHYHGYSLERDQVEEGITAEVGLDTKSSVLSKYGEPSTIGAFDPNVWYYIAGRREQRAFYKPKRTWSSVVAIRFDNRGAVSEVFTRDLADAKDLALVRRETPTRGKELSFLEQLLGNVGQLPTTAEGGPGGR
ncbi:MAG: outer membrane protein assembly factor BamE [Pseudomonadota bacterium]